MRFIPIPIFAVINSLVAVVIAKPITNQKAGGIAIPLTRHPSTLNSNTTTDLDAIISQGISVREKILSGLDNYERNTGTMHPFAVKQSDSESGLGRRAASLSLTTYRNKIWMAEISIGTPAKTLKVNVDTGAADMWVLQTGCAGISGDRDLWDPHSSDSAEHEQKPFELTYTDGSIVEGDRFTDNVTIGGFTADPQTFGSATSYTGSSLRPIGFPAADGLLALAFPAISDFGAIPLLESLVRQNRLINPTLSFKLTSSGAEMYIGGTNSMLYNGDIVYTPVTQPGFWQVSMDNVRVNDNVIIKDVPAILDTGTSHIFGDWDRVAELYKHLGGTLYQHGGLGFYYLRCDSFPTLSFTFGGKTFEIPPEVLIIAPIVDGSPYCFSGIFAQHIKFWIIGASFLQGVYTVFDYSAPRVGFANLA